MPGYRTPEEVERIILALPWLGRGHGNNGKKGGEGRGREIRVFALLAFCAGKRAVPYLDFALHGSSTTALAVACFPGELALARIGLDRSLRCAATAKVITRAAAALCWFKGAIPSTHSPKGTRTHTPQQHQRASYPSISPSNSSAAPLLSPSTLRIASSNPKKANPEPTAPTGRKNTGHPPTQPERYHSRSGTTGPSGRGSTFLPPDG
ncbi:hypothetical protein VE02_00980 [Pseudogymnoascus sp. 03VT05]|nr:hypothetical protein VE02_00980 [Pseudogymnoascus sp. 03VT05]